MTSTIEVGAVLPELHLTDPRGRPFSLRDRLATGPVVLYFMRSADCPVCRSHVGKLAADHGRIRAAGADVVVVVPDGPSAAGALAAKKRLPFAVVAGEAANAHEELGLTRSVGMRRSGTVIVGSDGAVRYARTALMPTGGLKVSDVLAALR